jgi:cyclophilin family peptidyl-prolyl cis-trans isomerase
MKNFVNLALAILISLHFITCSQGPTTVVLETSYGDMVIELFDDTPLHRDNFIKLVKEGYYDGLEFHRVIQGFMAQGGDPNSRNADPQTSLGEGGPGYTLPAEIKNHHFKGALAAARLGDMVNPQKESSGSQFYIVQGRKFDRNTLEQIAQSKGIVYEEADIQRYIEEGGTPQLDADYTVYGQVVQGMEVIDKIASVATGRADRPLEPIRMKIRQR